MPARTEMTATGSSAVPVIAVVGATGMVGRQVCAALAQLGRDRVAIRLVGRRPGAIARELAALAGASAHAAEPADAGDPGALARALAGARVVINAAGPLRATAVPVLEATLAAGAHYVDVGGEQDVLRALYERCESAVRRAGRIALPGAGVDAMLGDLAASWAAAHLAAAGDPGPIVRAAPAPVIADDRLLDEVAVSYAFDDLALSAGSQRALFGAIGERAVIWLRDRWEPGRAGDHRRINPGPVLGGERDALAYAGGAVITIPRHIAAHRVAAYVSPARSQATAAVLRVVSLALPFLPRTAASALVPYAAPGTDYSKTRFAVVTQVRRDFSAAQVIVHGRDLYRTTAVIAAWAARQIAERGPGPVGMCAPGELFRGEPALRAIASAADLTIEPSFG